MPCDNGHTGNEVPILRDLPVSQAGEGRHKCAVCSYYAGERATQASVRQQKLEAVAFALVGPTVITDLPSRRIERWSDLPDDFRQRFEDAAEKLIRDRRYETAQEGVAWNVAFALGLV